ncbi:equilibrative nucleoside transporter 4-like [Danio rerio]|uniref:Equilibrative nucleoside transporter 4-like n=1 Tax=Danio rerio TaxID=7955 RepID=A0A8M9PWY6_DANRE|nr:equilibrative nucleoside transporter 4-like [Danio rerio]XP_698839.3 equilibrative nucleoside transporter 4-like [Danio rerio]|eukprot:XP_021326781.1 equilibrative nucleoside transporter 4-like [Danio rerio]
MYSEEWSRNRQGREKTVITNFSFSQLPEEEKTGRRKPHSAHDSDESIPDDRYHSIYFAMLLAGVGFLLPYNSFITDVDYLHRKFKGTSIVFDMSLTYILVALSAVIVNNALVERLSLHTRICVGYLFALGPLVCVSVFDVWLELFNTQQSYAVTLAAVAIVAFGCTVQQSSFYGYTGMLPKRYTQGVMTGESTAGVIVSLSRIFTKLLVEDEKNNTIIFFLFSVSMETLCFLLHVVVRRTHFVRYHTSRARQSHSWLKGQINNVTTQKHSGYQIHYDSSAEEEDGMASSMVDDADAVNLGNGSHGDGIYVRFDVPKPEAKRSWISVKELLGRRCAVARVIWPYMLSILVTYFITLCLFPGLESELHNDTLGEWLPILTMALFNMADFVGKILAACPYEWGGVQLLVCSCLRVLFLPLFVMCVSPVQRPLLAHPAWPCGLSVMLGISNGYLGSVPMIQAAGKVPLQQREVAGNTMTVSYMAGLMLGSAVSYSTYSLTSQAHSSHTTLKLNSTLTLHNYMPGH